MLISDIAIRRPVFTTMVVIGLMTLGLLSASTLGVDLFPNASFPVVTVVTPYPGAGPEEVEQLVSKPVEDAVASIAGLEELHSYSRDSVSYVVILFKLGTDVEGAANAVREKVGGIRNTMPRDIREPIIQRMDPDAIAILTYAVSSKRGAAETRRLAEDVIKPRLQSVDGVGGVTVLGGLEREIHIYVDRSRVDALGLSLAQIAQQLGTESFDVPGGRLTLGASEMNVRTLGRFRSIEELQNVVVASLPNGSQVRLADVARVEDGFKEVRTRPLLDGVQAVTIEVQKQAGTNTVALADALQERIGELKEQLPEDLQISTIIDQSEFIRFNIADVEESILWGGLMAILVIFIFMLDWRSTLISSLALPTSVVTTFVAMKLFGFSFNMMTLMGLSLAIGLLIDDAVVVRENIYRHMERGEDPITAARRGTAEIGLAVMATTFTIVAVFVPVAFMGGMVGQFFREFGLTVASAVLVSLFISFTLDPMMSARVVKAIEPGHHERLKRHRVFGPIVRSYEGLDRWYRSLLAWSLGHKKTVVFSAVGVFVASVMLMPLMGSEFMSAGDRGEFRIALEAPAGTSFAEMEALTHQAEVLVRQNPHIKRLYTIVAPGEEAHKAVLRVYATKKKDRPGTTQEDIKDDLRERLASLPSVKSIFGDIQMMDNAGMDRPVYIQVRGENYEELQRLARQVLEVVRTTKGTKDVDMSYRPGKPETTIRVDRQRAADLGTSVGMVAQTVRLALEGDVVAKYRHGEKDYDVRLHLTPEDRRSAAVLPELTVPATGRRFGAMMAAPHLVRLSETAEISPGTGPATIERFARQRQILVTASLSDRSLGDVVADIQQGMEKIEKPAGYLFQFAGQTKNMRESFESMLLALVVAILFIYFVLASQFESFIHPLTIMMSLPLAFVGAIILLFLGGYPLNMIAFIGIILLMGLVTKNAILLVDYTNELRARGRSMVEALLEAGPTRLRPILMTSAAMVLGMVPAAVSRGEGSEMRVPMAMAVIGGVIASTFLTLVVVPVIYTWMDRFTLKKRSAATVDVYEEEVKAAVQDEPALPIPTVVAKAASLRRDA